MNLTKKQPVNGTNVLCYINNQKIPWQTNISIEFLLEATPRYEVECLMNDTDYYSFLKKIENKEVTFTVKHIDKVIIESKGKLKKVKSYFAMEDHALIKFVIQ